MEVEVNSNRVLLWIAVLAMAYFTACNYTVGECYPRGQSGGNTGAGAAGSVAVGVGASATGDYAADPPKQPQDATNPPPDCNSPPDATELGTYIRCRGLDAMTCVEMCYDIGAICAPLRVHPYGSMGGNGRLKQCMENTTSHTCTYCYENGDVCSFLYSVLTPTGRPFCGYTGGKGCE
jgi:hypothetical protein